MVRGGYHGHNNEFFMPYKSFFLNNYNTQLRHSVVSFKKEEPTVPVTNL
jgi:hypothetical protein